MTAPTEDEIRATIAEHATWPKSEPLSEQLEQVVEDWANALDTPAYTALDASDARTANDDLDALWCDLRTSEALRLRELVNAAADRAKVKARRAIEDELLDAALTFSREYPEAPRPGAPARQH